MSDKEVIIDGVNVAGCSSLELDCGVYYCYEYNKNVRCDCNPNCYYKKLQREKKLNKVNLQRSLDLNKEIESLNTECDLWEKQNAKLKQEIKDLKEKYKWYDHYKDSALLNKDLCNKKSDELERLQADNEEYKTQAKKYPADYFAENKKANRYKQALEEIKEKAQENDELLQGYHHEWANNKLILDIINEVLKCE